MELERQILNDFFNQTEKMYDEAEIETKIMMQESMLKKELTKSQSFAIDKLKVLMREYTNLEMLHLITFVLEYKKQL